MSRPLGFAVALLILAAPVVADDDLEKAIVRRDVAAVRALLAAGADLEAQGDRGRPPLLLAARHGDTAIIRLLTEAGANVNAQDTRGATALHIAVHHKHLAAVKLLIQQGANPRLKNAKGYDAIEAAAKLVLREPENLRRQEIAAYLANTPRGAAQASPGLRAGPPDLNIGFVTVDVAPYRATAEALRNAAVNALLARGWTIIASEPEREVGQYRRKDVEYRVEIRFLPDTVRIAFLRGYAAKRSNYLRNLEKDFLEGLPYGAGP